MHLCCKISLPISRKIHNVMAYTTLQSVRRIVPDPLFPKTASVDSPSIRLVRMRVIGGRGLPVVDKLPETSHS
jgi:hypothetical protein